MKIYLDTSTLNRIFDDQSQPRKKIMTIKTEGLPDVKELKTEVIELVAKNFGITKAAFFIRELMSQKIDYLEIKEKLFGGKTSAELYNDICKWKKG